MKIILKSSLLIGILIGVSCSKTVNDEPSLEVTGSKKFNATVSMGSLAIKGLKWKNEMNAQDDASSARYETEGLSYAKAARKLDSLGVPAVVLKVAELSIMPPGTTTADIHNEVVNMVIALKNNAPGIKVYLWQRQWLQKGGAGNTGAEDFAEEMKVILNKNAEAKSHISGIALIENNLETSGQVLAKSLLIAQKINAKTNGWLKTKTFLFPGAAMGSWFKGINTATGNSTFFSQMAPEVEHFSFIYKHMISQEEAQCSLYSPEYSNWTTTVGPLSTKTVAEQETYLNETMGVNDLYTFLNTYKAQYPDLCNVTFWGDSGDGMIKMGRNSILAVNNMLVQNPARQWKSYFFDLPYTTSTASAADLTKFIAKVSTSGIVTRNTGPNSTGITNVWDEWNKWQWAAPGY